MATVVRRQLNGEGRLFSFVFESDVDYSDFCGISGPDRTLVLVDGYFIPNIANPIF